MIRVGFNVRISQTSRLRLWRMLRPGGRAPRPTDKEYAEAIEKLMREALDARDAKRKVTS